MYHQTLFFPNTYRFSAGGGGCVCVSSNVSFQYSSGVSGGKNRSLCLHAFLTISAYAFAGSSHPSASFLRKVSHSGHAAACSAARPSPLTTSLHLGVSFSSAFFRTAAAARAAAAGERKPCSFGEPPAGPLRSWRLLSSASGWRSSLPGVERAFFAGLPFPSGEASSSSIYSVRSEIAERFDRRRFRFSLEDAFDGV